MRETLARNMEAVKRQFDAIATRGIAALRGPEPFRSQAPDITAYEASFFADPEDTPRKRINHLPSRDTRILLAATALLNTTCASELQERTLGPSAAREQVSFTVSSDAVDIQVPDVRSDKPYTIHIVDYDNADAWDLDLQNAFAKGLNNSVEQHALYMYHVGLFRDQYSRSLGYSPETPDAQTHLVMGDDGTKSFRINKYENEPSRMEPGMYPAIAEQYGKTENRPLLIGAPMVVEDVFANLDMGDRAHVEEYFFGFATRMAQERRWGSLDHLSAQQWIQVIDASVDGIPYDFRLAGGSEEYNAKLADQVNQMTISELLDRRQEGMVCRDMERLKISFYLVADAEYQLSTRGLQMLPLGNYSDAAHARDAYMILESSHDVTVVVTDSTNTSFAQALTQMDSSTGSAAAWYGQQFGKEWMNPEVAQEYYHAIIAEYGNDMFPTTVAIAQREELVAAVQVAHSMEQQVGNDDRTVQDAYQHAYDLLSRQLSYEYQMDGSSAGGYLRRPDRTVPLFDLLLELGKKADEHQANRMNYLLALRQFVEYRQQRGMTAEDLVIARQAIQELDVQGSDPSAVEQFVESEISRLETELHIRSD